MGFIPSPDEFYELTKEQYSAYKKQGGDVSKHLYTIIPKNYKYLEKTPPNELSLVTKEEMLSIGKAAIFLFMYAEENGCKSQKGEDVLRFSAQRLPSSLTKGTNFERPPFKVINSTDKYLTDQEEWIDFLVSLMGNGTTLKIKATYSDTNETKEISIPIKKIRE
jgi:hypothetical protein